MTGWIDREAIHDVYRRDARNWRRRGAALINGMFAHSMDFNDDHAGIQVGDIIEFLKKGTDTKRYHVAKAAHGGALSVS